MSGNLKQKRCANNTEFKSKVVQYADTCNNNRQMTQEFNVSEKQVQDWQKAMLDLAEMPQPKKACRGGSHDFPKKNEN